MDPPSLDALDGLDVAYARFNAARSLRPKDPELTVADVGGLSVLHDPSRPKDETYNRVVGLTEARLSSLDEALATFEGSPAPPQIDLAIDRLSPAVASALRERGFAPTMTLAWLWAPPGAVAREDRAIHVERYDDGGRFLRLMSELESPIDAAVIDRRARWYATESFRAYVALVDGEPAGWATLFIDADRGVLGNAFVSERSRRRGAHGALHRARARDAVGLGLSWLVCDMLHETASHRNALRAGMRRRTSYVWFRR